MTVTAEQITARRQLIAQMEALDTPQATEDAASFATLLHHEQTNLLATDVYGAAKGHRGNEEEQSPPTGWLRGSENLEALRQAVPGLKSVGDDQLLDMFKPNNSGFRAEIYLPDPTILGDSFKPVIVPKGSGGEVLFTDANGTPRLRDTTNEDFLANNFPQAIGEKSDYYDRAMRLAVMMKEAGFTGEFAGHSLAGGLVTAMAAVTGLPATTVNAAGLHPDTAQRFAQENPGVVVHDTVTIVTAYQVKGELLNDGLQNNMERRDVHERRVLGNVFSDAATLMKTLPHGRQWLEQEILNNPDISKQLPENAQVAVSNFLDRVANGDTQKMLDELPLAAGKVHVLDQPMARENGTLIRRQDQMQLAEATVLAVPVMEVADRALTSARVSSAAAEVPARVLNYQARAIDTEGDAIERAANKAADFQDVSARVVRGAVTGTVDAVGDLAAGARERLGRAEAAVDDVQGNIQQGTANAGARVLRFAGGWLSDSLEKKLSSAADRLEEHGLQAAAENTKEAAQSRARGEAGANAIRQTATDVTTTLDTVHVTATRAQSDALRNAGSAANAALDVAADSKHFIAANLPFASAIAGGTLAGMGEVAHRTVDGLSPARNVTSMGTEAARQLSADDGETTGWRGILQSSEAAKLVKDVTDTGRLVAHGGAAVGEAVERHLGLATLVPTFEAMTQARQKQLEQLYGPAIEVREAINARTRFENNPLVASIRQAVATAEERIGKPWDEASERLTASVAVLAHRNGFRASDELTIGFNPQTPAYRAGEIVHIMRTGPNTSTDPSQNRAHMSTTEAIAEPANITYANYERTTRETSQQHSEAQQLEQQRALSSAMSR